MSIRDYRDDLIADLAASEADLLKRLAIAEGACATWKLIAVGAIHHSHELYRETQRESVMRLRQENGQLREALMLQEPKAA